LKILQTIKNSETTNLGEYLYSSGSQQKCTFSPTVNPFCFNPSQQLTPNKTMKSHYIIGAAAVLLTGVAGAWGVHEYFSLKAQLKEVQKDAQSTSNSPSPTPSPPTQDGVNPATVPPTPSPSPAPTPESNFDALPLCDQLDRIFKAGKSVSEFIVNSGRYQEFEAEVTAKCNWHKEQLKLADQILHPPVVVDPPDQSDPPDPSSDGPKPRRTPWNNCNGLQEPGESASIECRAKKKQSGKPESSGDDHYYGR
jgi:hypothetical protein